jgi:hypothetical protein
VLGIAGRWERAAAALFFGLSVGYPIGGVPLLFGVWVVLFALSEVIARILAKREQNPAYLGWVGPDQSPWWGVLFAALLVVAIVVIASD